MPVLEAKVHQQDGNGDNFSTVWLALRDSMQEQVGISSFQGCTQEIPLRGAPSPGLSKVAARSQSVSVPLLQANLCQPALPCLDRAGR